MKTRLPVVILVQFFLALSPFPVFGAVPAASKTTEKAPITLESASALADKKQYEEALDICDALIAKKGMNRLDALKLKIRIYERATWWSEALTRYEKLLKTATSTAARNDIRVSMARIKALELNDPAGVSELSKLSNERIDKPLLGRVRYWLAGALMNQGKIEESKAAFARFIADFSDLPEIDPAKGYLAQCEATLQAQAERAKKHRDELAARQKAEAESKTAAKTPERTEQWLQKAEVLKQQGKFKEAAKVYESVRFQGFGSDLAPATYGLAECRYALGDVDKAVEMWEAVLKLPANAGV